WPGLHALFGTTYDDIPRRYDDIFRVEKSDKAYEEIVELSGFGLAPIKAEGASIVYDSTSQGPTSRFTNVVYGLGFIETRESVEDNQYKGRATQRTRALARSMSVTKETVHANIFNRAFNAQYLGSDGKPLIATDHPTLGGTQSNRLAVDADLSEASLEDALIQIRTAKDRRGLPINLTGAKLVVPPGEAFNAKRILGSTGQNDTANNAINAMKSMGMLPGGVIDWVYLTDPDAWFIVTDVDQGLISFQRRALEFAKDGDFDTDNFKHKATERYVPGWADWRAVFGTPGA
ncbi:MAG: hypothetical protein EON59_16360, partial [Alphaproteobacteria bacterium]